MSRIAVVSVAVSVAVMLVALAVILGFKREVTARMVGFSAPVEVIDGARDLRRGVAARRGDCTVRGVAAHRRRRAAGDALCRQERDRAHARCHGGRGAQRGGRLLRLVVFRRPAHRREAAARRRFAAYEGAAALRTHGAPAGRTCGRQGGDALRRRRREAPPRPVQGVGTLFDGDGGVGAHGADRPAQRAAVVGVVVRRGFGIRPLPRRRAGRQTGWPKRSTTPCCVRICRRPTASWP